MKVPHCATSTFRNGIVFKILLGELRESRFTGYCAIPFGETVTSLVYEDGICILAEHQGDRGYAALLKLGLIADQTVDAALCPYNRTQIAVSNKMNERCRVVFPRAPPHRAPKGPDTTSVRSVSIPGSGTKPVRVAKVHTARHPEKSAPAQGTAPAARAAPGHPAPKRATEQGEEKLNRNNLESLKTLKETFNAAELLAELNLGHLVVKPQGKPQKSEGSKGEDKNAG